MTGSPNYYTGSKQLSKWARAGLSAANYPNIQNLDRFAKAHYRSFPKHPPDQFDRILWKHPKLLRLENRSSAKWARANKAGGPNGILTRLFRHLVVPVFITSPITEIGFTQRDSSYENYHDRVLITEIKEALKEHVSGSAWFSLEVSRRKSLIHAHALCDHSAYGFNAYSVLVYEPVDLFKYLIKGIPYNSWNLAAFWKAKKLLPPGKQLVRKTGTIRVPLK
jgi:hypothetical protein